ncbi:unnamed protein product [Rotaria sp. Silwood1]|nr:unnamed protein product [Rotaria sp. Silwood1]CAF1430966.1 unnamed protein product [Rotaria sp. Silwood1]CAF3565401.1 unnamed protein product [Rotaria sp. Silwood1]CAF3577226.1 unnamed protein product [Rotaria sp. Silwood1]CAF3587859.1 unnamed protein product [Rotaria sp. Silwood1]
MASFLELEYVWNDNSLVPPPCIPGYCFDPINADYSTNKDSNIADDQRIEEARKAIEQHNRNLDKNTKKKPLLNIWKKN